MIIYIFTIFLVIVCGDLSIRCSTHSEINTLGIHYVKLNTLFRFMVGAILILVYALRWKTGTDTATYISIYTNIGKYSLKEILLMNERVFFLINWIDYHVFGGSLILHNIVLGSLTYCPVIYLYEKFSNKFDISILLAILTTFYFFGFNGQRQALAVGICIIAYLFLQNKRYILTGISLVIAMQIHTVALIMLPIFILTNRKTKSRVFVVGSSILILSAIFLSNIWDKLFSLLNLLGQDTIVSRYAAQNNFYGGSNIIRLLVVLIPVILGIYKYRNLNECSVDYDRILNLNIVTCICLLAGTYNWLFARLAQFTMPFLPILLIRLADAFEEKSRKLYYGMVIFLFFIYMLVYLKNDSNLLPYYFINDSMTFY